MHYIKKILKVALIISIILLVVFVGYRFKKLYSEGKFDEVLYRNRRKVTYVNSTDSDELKNKDSNNTEDDGSDNNSNGDDSSSSTLQLETPTDEYYNKFNFDNVLLLYEGEQKSNETIEALDRLIQDADDSLYRKPKVVFENFTGLSAYEITPDNIEEYKKVLNEARNTIKDGTYTFSFEYTKLKSIVDKIIITKN